jgi:hypothetical protein
LGTGNGVRLAYVHLRVTGYELKEKEILEYWKNGIMVRPWGQIFILDFGQWETEWVKKEALLLRRRGCGVIGSTVARQVEGGWRQKKRINGIPFG